MPDRLKDSDFLKCPLDVSELISSSMNNPSIKGLSELHRKQWYNMLPYFRGLYIRFYDFVYAKAILAVFSLIFSLQTRSSILHIAPDQPRPKDNMFFLLFQLFQSTKIPNMDDNFRTNWISADSVCLTGGTPDNFPQSLNWWHSVWECIVQCDLQNLSVFVCVCVCAFVIPQRHESHGNTSSLPSYLHAHTFSFQTRTHMYSQLFLHTLPFFLHSDTYTQLCMCQLCFW